MKGEGRGLLYYNWQQGELSSENRREAIRIYTLGQLRLERRTGAHWEVVTEIARQHQRERSLLSCLLSVSSRRLSREQIIEALWPNLDLEAGTSRLDSAVYNLRKIFEPTRSRLASSPILLVERTFVNLAGQELVWVDADEFERLHRQAVSSLDPGWQELLFARAAMLYGGDFLPEEHELEWTLSRRETLSRSWATTLLTLSDLRIARGMIASALELLKRLFAVDPMNEAAAQRLMSLLAQQGRQDEAVRVYKRLAAALRQEFRIAPLPETRALYEAVRRSLA
jgi:DNA-binding SARP family transcriptional activator